MSPKIALLLIDIQLGLNDSTYWGKTRSTPTFETNISTILTYFRSSKLPIFHVAHHSVFPTSPLHPSKPTASFQPYAAPLPSEPIFTKNVNSAFIGNELETTLRALNLECLVVCGLTTDHCVSTSVRMAANLGVVRNFDKNGGVASVGEGKGDGEKVGKIVVLSDATATFEKSWKGREFDAETVHAVSLASLDGEFCEVRVLEEFLREIKAVED